MQFNTLHFAFFFIVVYILYLISNHKWQNRLLLLASYVFYCFWDWRFSSLIAISTVLNYYFGMKIEGAPNEHIRKTFLVIIVCLNLAILGIFKYFDFFAYNFNVLMWQLGWHISIPALYIILPLGISFYTFQALSYPVDIYRKIIKPTKQFPDFALFIAFFPVMTAGPIERARNLLPQILNKRIVTKECFYEGCWLIFWGLYKKIVVADNLAKVARFVFDTGGHYSGLEILVATYAFAFQIYADFSGYSDMARGLARVMGFDIMVNFRVPFFSRNIYEFWQRWHISLTTWIKEYIYYPLALAKFYGKELAAPLVVLITWSLMGFWHGASWKFVLWGTYHGVLIVIYSKIKPYLSAVRIENKALARISAILQMLFVFNLFCIGIIFFAAQSMSQVLAIFQMLFSNFTAAFRYDPYVLTLILILMSPLFIIEYIQHRLNDDMAVLRLPPWAQAVFYYVILYAIVLYGDYYVQKFYYFQF